jgi:hypothetical protein
MTASVPYRISATWRLGITAGPYILLTLIAHIGK